MTFLNDDVIPEPTRGNLDSDNDDEGDNNNVSEDMDRMTEISQDSATTTSSSSRRKNKSATEVRDEFLELENKKIKLLETKYADKKTTDDLEKDEDYHFFMSLIPQMKSFTNI
ncbi:unnamed protein product [Parnassius apollo]|uniref:(apollo) hypothetical protein n=1 Tax=Parnassius apollo TaxID=110799 RepID=A0A8S3WUD9_PARAO|nr:unnamed protein product [Parnassius apollo]